MGLFDAPALSPRVARNQFSPRRRPVATGLHIPSRNAVALSLSDGTSTGITTQMEHAFDVACTDVQCTYINSYNNDGTPADGPNPITIKTAWRRAGVNWPGYIRGVRSALLDPAGLLTSDAIGMTFARGDLAYSHTGVSVTAGQKYPLGSTTKGGTEGVVAGDAVDGAVGGNVGKSYGPHLITGIPLVPIDSPVIGILGDSNGVGYNDIALGSDAYGYVRRALDTKMSYVNLSYSGSGATNSNTEYKLRHRLAVADKVRIDDWYLPYGTNDLSTGTTAAAIQANILAIAAILLKRGERVFCATIPPRTTSTDAWATAGNQTKMATEAQRLEMNAWFRSVPAPFTACIDLADDLETARNSGLWKPEYTLDGTHPSAAGTANVAASSFTPSRFGKVLPT